MRFSKRTQSLDYIEAKKGSPAESRHNTKPNTGGKSPKIGDNNKRNDKRYSKDWSSSGEELCTDEFLIVNYGNKSGIPAANKKAPQKPAKPVVALKRTPSSVSSPNLVFDPVSNTAGSSLKTVPNQTIARLGHAEGKARKLFTLWRAMVALASKVPNGTKGFILTKYLSKRHYIPNSLTLSLRPSYGSS